MCHIFTLLFKNLFHRIVKVERWGESVEKSSMMKEIFERKRDNVTGSRGA